MSRADLSALRSGARTVDLGGLLGLVPRGTSGRPIEPRQRQQRRRDQRAARRMTIPSSGRSIARAYFGELARIVRQLNAIIDGLVTAQLDGLVSIANAEFSRDSLHVDQVEEILEGLIDEVRAEFGRAFTQGQLQQLVAAHGFEVSEFNRKQVARQFAQGVGVNVFAESPALQRRLDQFGKKNSRLITKMAREHMDRVQSIVSEGLTSGRTQRQIARDLQDVRGIPRRRALLIARDQVAKLNGQLAVDRMAANGVTRGIWRTVGDERVRDEHAAREGQEFDLNKGIDGELPGQPINCRCVTEPLFEGFTEGITGPAFQ